MTRPGELVPHAEFLPATLWVNLFLWNSVYVSGQGVKPDAAIPLNAIRLIAPVTRHRLILRCLAKHRPLQPAFY